MAPGPMTHEVFPPEIPKPIRYSQGTFKFLHHSQLASLYSGAIRRQQIRLLLDQIPIQRPQPLAFQAIHYAVNSSAGDFP